MEQTCREGTAEGSALRCPTKCPSECAQICWHKRQCRWRLLIQHLLKAVLPLTPALSTWRPALLFQPLLFFSWSDSLLLLLHLLKLLWFPPQPTGQGSPQLSKRCGWAPGPSRGKAFSHAPVRMGLVKARNLSLRFAFQRPRLRIHLLTSDNIWSLLFFFFSLFRATRSAHGGSQVRGRIGTAAAGLRYSHSNSRSKPHLRPTAQLTAMLDP